MTPISRKSRRAQAAMEYLTTYGWAVLVVMIVGIILWELGILSPGGQSAYSSIGFPRIKPQMALNSMNESGYFKGVFTNGAGGPVFFESVTCQGLDLTFPAYKVGFGDNFDVNGSCGFTGALGNPFSVDITLTYNVSVGGGLVSHIDVGTLNGPIE